MDKRMSPQHATMPPERTIPSGSDLYMLATTSDAKLFLALKSVLSIEDQGAVTHFNKDGSRLKVHAVEACHVVDVHVQVLQVGNWRLLRCWQRQFLRFWPSKLAAL